MFTAMRLPSIEDIREVLSVAELAKRAGFGRRTLYEWLQNGDVPGSGMAKEYRIKAIRDALEMARAEKLTQPARPKRRRAGDGARNAA